MTAANIAFAQVIPQSILPERVISNNNNMTTDYSQSASHDGGQIILAFDLYGTILSTASISHALSKHFGQDRADGMAAMWRTLQLEYTWRLNSMGQYQPFSTVTRSSLLATLRSQGEILPEDDVGALLDEYNNLHLFPDVAGALKALPGIAGVEAYVFTNGTDRMVRSSLSGSPDLAPLANVFKDVVTVEEVRAFKPAPSVYWHLLTKVGKSREQAGDVWLVSGNAFDIVGARSLGLKGCWVDREGKGWTDACVDGKEPDLIVKGLHEVVEKIRRVQGN